MGNREGNASRKRNEWEVEGDERARGERGSGRGERESTRGESGGTERRVEV